MSSSPTFASGISNDLLDKLYSAPTSTGSPGLPGQTHESTQAVLEVLRHDMKNHAPFVNDLKFHNHSSHHVLALYALGVSPELIKDVYYKTHLPTLQPSLVSPGPITEENFIDHLGDEKYYDAYLEFFIDYLQSHSPTEALERFVFSPAYNFRSELAADGRDLKENVQPQMLSRLLDGLIHPFIQLAFGFEFGILGQIAQGLAQVAVHDAVQTELIPPSYFTNSTTVYTTNGDLSKHVHRLEISGGPSASSTALKKRPTFAFHRRLREYPALSGIELPSSPLHQYAAVAKIAGGVIHTLVQEWTEEWLAGADDVEARLRDMVEEVVWGNVIWYGIGGWASRGTDGCGFKADFFLAHLVTSALFLPKLILKDESSSTGGLSFANRLLLLQTYLAVSATWTVMRGGHRVLPIADFYAATDAQQLAPSKAGVATQPPGNAWPRVIQSAVRFQDEHMPKIARALADFAVRWGTLAPGYFAAHGEEENARTGAGAGPALEGIERLDGTLFVRVAGLTFDRLGWVDEGENARLWDRDSM